MSRGIVMVLLALAGELPVPCQSPVARGLPPTGETLNAELLPGQTHIYEIRLDEGIFLHVDVLRQDADLVARLLDPQARELARVTRTPMGYPKLHFAIVAATGGAYRLEVSWNNRARAAAPYRVKTEELRPATAEDRKREDAETTARKAESLRNGPLASRREAIALYDRARQLFHELDDQENEASQLVNLGAAHYLLGEPAEAVALFEQALPLKQALADTKGEANLWSNLGVVHDSMGEPERSVDAYTNALALARKAADRRLESTALSNLGATLAQLGRPDEALQRLLEARTAALSVDDRRATEGHALTLLGDAYADLGDAGRAEDCLTQAVAIARDLGDARGQALALNHLGSARRRTNDVAGALRFHEQALSLVRGVGDKKSEASTLLRIAGLRRRLGEAPKAADHANQALALARSAADPRNEAAALRELGEAKLLAGGAVDAEPLLAQALSIVRRIGARPDEAEALAALARTDRAQDRFDDARQHIESAIAIYEELRGRLVSPDLRASYFAGRTRDFEFLVDLLMARRLDAAALAAHEQSRARVLLDLLGESRSSAPANVDAPLLRRERSLRAVLQAKSETRIRLLAGQHTPSQLEAVERDITRLLAEHGDVESQIRAASPRWSTLAQPPSPSVARLQRDVLEPRTALLEIALGDQRSFVWLVTTSGFRSATLPSRAEVERLARAAYDQLRSPAGSQGDSLQRLGHMLLEPFRTSMDGLDRLLIVADGALEYIPFAALPFANAPLIEKLQVISLPSASTLALARAKARPAPAPRLVAIFADPVFTTEDARLAAKTAPPAPPVDALTRSIEDLGVALDRLPATRREADAIAELAGARGVLKLVDFDASRDNALSDRLAQYRILHFATHGLLNARRPELSGLVLSLVDAGGRSKPGFLAAHEIYSLQLHADLVVLSACQTALGPQVRGEGLISLTRAFLFAGAPRVVASLWQVPDVGAAELMKRFYRAMLTDHLPPGAALRAAQNALRADKRWQAPFFWAGFTLQGDWR